MLFLAYLLAVTSPIFLYLLSTNVAIKGVFWAPSTLTFPERPLLNHFETNYRSCGRYDSGISYTISHTIGLGLPATLTYPGNDPVGPVFDIFGFILLLCALTTVLFITVRLHNSLPIIPYTFIYAIPSFIRIASANGFAWLYLQTYQQAKQVPSYLVLIKGRGLDFLNFLVVAFRAVKTQYQNLARVTKRLVGVLGEVIKVAKRFVGVIGEVLRVVFRLSKRLVGGLVKFLHICLHADEYADFASHQLWTFLSEAGVQLQQELMLSQVCGLLADLEIELKWYHFDYISDAIANEWGEAANLELPRKPTDSLIDRVPARALPHYRRRFVSSPYFQPPRIDSLDDRPIPVLSSFRKYKKGQVFASHASWQGKLYGRYDKPTPSKRLRSPSPYTSAKRSCPLSRESQLSRFALFRFARKPLQATRRRRRSPMVPHKELSLSRLVEEITVHTRPTDLPPEAVVASNESREQSEPAPQPEESNPKQIEIVVDSPSLLPPETAVVSSESSERLVSAPQPEELAPKQSETPVGSPQLPPMEPAAPSLEQALEQAFEQFLEQADLAPQPEELDSMPKQLVAVASSETLVQTESGPVQMDWARDLDRELDEISQLCADLHISDQMDVEVGDCELPVEAPVVEDRSGAAIVPLSEVKSVPSADVDMPLAPGEHPLTYFLPPQTPREVNRTQQAVHLRQKKLKHSMRGIFTIR